MAKKIENPAQRMSESDYDPTTPGLTTAILLETGINSAFFMAKVAALGVANALDRVQILVETAKRTNILKRNF